MTQVYLDQTAWFYNIKINLYGSNCTILEVIGIYKRFRCWLHDDDQTTVIFDKIVYYKSTHTHTHTSLTGEKYHRNARRIAQAVSLNKLPSDVVCSLLTIESNTKLIGERDRHPRWRPAKKGKLLIRMTQCKSDETATTIQALTNKQVKVYARVVVRCVQDWWAVQCSWSVWVFSTVHKRRWQWHYWHCLWQSPAPVPLASSSTILTSLRSTPARWWASPTASLQRLGSSHLLWLPSSPLT